tara:strand:+ start:3550 stop:3738 length:189 start_codon:yes stop_codon:yes gene_type:complete
MDTCISYLLFVVVLMCGDVFVCMGMFFGLLCIMRVIVDTFTVFAYIVAAVAITCLFTLRGRL